MAGPYHPDILTHRQAKQAMNELATLLKVAICFNAAHSTEALIVNCSTIVLVQGFHSKLTTGVHIVSSSTEHQPITTQSTKTEYLQILSIMIYTVINHDLHCIHRSDNQSRSMK